MIPQCGTEQGYDRHRAAGETTCALCRRAAADARRDRRYRLALGEYDAMYCRQRGRCYICGGEHKKGKLVVDHHHASGTVRHLLCNWCNSLLGQCLESTDILHRAVSYLEGTLDSPPSEFLGDLTRKDSA